MLGAYYYPVITLRYYVFRHITTVHHEYSIRQWLHVQQFLRQPFLAVLLHGVHLDLTSGVLHVFDYY